MSTKSEEPDDRLLGSDDDDEIVACANPSLRRECHG